MKILKTFEQFKVNEDVLTTSELSLLQSVIDNITETESLGDSQKMQLRNEIRKELFDIEFTPDELKVVAKVLDGDINENIPDETVNKIFKFNDDCNRIIDKLKLKFPHDDEEIN